MRNEDLSWRDETPAGSMYEVQRADTPAHGPVWRHRQFNRQENDAPVSTLAWKSGPPPGYSVRPAKVAYPLSAANRMRQKEWMADKFAKMSIEDLRRCCRLLFRAVEMGGEVGEAMNVMKKLAREMMGARGSRATVAELGDELADVVITADLCTDGTGIDLFGTAVPRKFDATSVKYDLTVRFGDFVPRGQTLRPKTKRGHDLYRRGDPDLPDSIKDRNGDVALGLCRICNAGERELDEYDCPMPARRQP